MSEDYNKKTRSWCVTRAIVTVLVVPVGMSVGILLGLISDFGLDFTVDNIRANPDIFAKQYAWPIVIGGWAAVVALVVLIVIVLTRRYGKPPTKD
jgi:ABC-type Fe3+ transport system permease subunit